MCAHYVECALGNVRTTPHVKRALCPEAMERAQRVLARRDLYTSNKLPWHYTDTRRARNRQEYWIFDNLFRHIQRITTNEFGKSIPDIIVRIPEIVEPEWSTTTVTIRRKLNFDSSSADYTEEKLFPGSSFRLAFIDLPYVLYRLVETRHYFQTNLFAQDTRPKETRYILDTTSIGVRHIKIGDTVYNLQSFQLPPD